MHNLLLNKNNCTYVSRMSHYPSLFLPCLVFKKKNVYVYKKDRNFERKENEIKKNEKEGRNEIYA